MTKRKWWIYALFALLVIDVIDDAVEITDKSRLKDIDIGLKRNKYKLIVLSNAKKDEDTSDKAEETEETDGEKTAEDIEKAEEKAEQCRVATLVQNVITKRQKFPQFEKLTGAVSAQYECPKDLPQLEDSSDGYVCKKTEAYKQCCSDEYDKNLAMYFTEKECLMASLVSGSILQQLTKADGHLAQGVSRLREAAANETSSTMAAIYKEQAKLFEEIQVN